MYQESKALKKQFISFSIISYGAFFGGILYAFNWLFNLIIYGMRNCRIGVAQPFAGEVTRALDAITERIRQLTRVEQLRRAEAAAKRTAADVAGPDTDPKRLKLDPDAPGGTSSAARALVDFDWRAIGRDVATDLIIANLQNFSEEAILRAITVSVHHLDIL